MDRARSFSFVVLGGVSLAAQVLLVREALAVFTGNEFFIGWTLFAWLFWTALGAGLAGRGREAAETVRGRVAACHLAAALLLPAQVAALRAARAGLGGGAGMVPDLLPGLGFLLVVFAPLCLVLGAQFVFAMRSLMAGGAEDSCADRRPGQAYALETAGFAAGGLLFSLAFVTWDPFRLAGLLGCLNLAAAWMLSSGRIRLGAAGVAAGAAVLLAAGERMDRATEAWRYPGQALVEARRSIYGSLAVTTLGAQRNFHENGLLLGAEDEQLASEPLVHFPMLWHPGPRQVLLIGGGFNGALGEILKHDPVAVDYVEMDPELIALARRHAGAARRAALDDPRVRTIAADANRFVRRPAEPGPAARYDVVLLNLPGPGTLLLNRFYTREFFRAARRRLAPGGVLAVRLAFSPDYLGRELETLGAAIDRTLRAEFATVALLPDYDLLFLAAEGPAPTAEDLVARYAARGLRTGFLSPPAIRERLATDRIGQVQAAFAANRAARINRDAQPIACAYTQAYWLRAFQPRAAAVAGRLAAAGWPWGAALAVLALLTLAVAVRRRPERLGPWAKGVGGFSLLSCELILLLLYQVYYGYLYYRIALILAVMMLGMAAGTALGARRPVWARPAGLAVLHLLTAFGAAGLIGFLPLLAHAGAGNAMEWGFLLWAAALGAVAGCEFPVALGVRRGGTESLARRTGAVYAADLAGSGLGALLTGLWAVPVLGAATTLALLAALNLATALVAATSRRPE